MGPPGGVDRWIALELGRLNAGLVVAKKSLAALRAELRPTCETREGQEVAIDRGALDRLAAVLTDEDAEDLRIPITVFVRGDLDDVAFVTDALAAKALRATEGFGEAFPYREGRMYLPHSLAIDLVRAFGGAVQLAFG